MLIMQAHLINVRDLDEEDEAYVLGLDGDSYIEILKGSIEFPESLGETWILEDIEKGSYSEGDKFVLDPEYYATEVMESLGFKDSGQKTENGYMIFW